MAKLTTEKLNEIKSALEDIASMLERRKNDAEEHYQNLDETLADVNRIQDNLEEIDDPDGLAVEAQELADKVAPEEKKE